MIVVADAGPLLHWPEPALTPRHCTDTRATSKGSGVFPTRVGVNR